MVILINSEQFLPLHLLTSRNRTWYKEYLILRFSISRRFPILQLKIHLDIGYVFTAMGAVMTGDQEDDTDTTMEPIKMEDFDHWMSRFVDKNSKLALLLDYDGDIIL